MIFKLVTQTLSTRFMVILGEHAFEVHRGRNLPGAYTKVLSEWSTLEEAAREVVLEKYLAEHGLDRDELDDRAVDYIEAKADVMMRDRVRKGFKATDRGANLVELEQAGENGPWISSRWIHRREWRRNLLVEYGIYTLSGAPTERARQFAADELGWALLDFHGLDTNEFDDNHA